MSYYLVHVFPTSCCFHWYCCISLLHFLSLCLVFFSDLRLPITSHHHHTAWVTECLINCCSSPLDKETYYKTVHVCSLQPLCWFWRGGGGSVKVVVSPGHLAQLHRPELDPGCGPDCCHGNGMISGTQRCRMYFMFYWLWGGWCHEKQQVNISPLTHVDLI